MSDKPQYLRGYAKYQKNNHAWTPGEWLVLFYEDGESTPSIIAQVDDQPTAQLIAACINTAKEKGTK